MNTTSTNPVAVIIDAALPNPTHISAHEAIAEHHTAKQQALYDGIDATWTCHSRVSQALKGQSGARQLSELEDQAALWWDQAEDHGSMAQAAGRTAIALSGLRSGLLQLREWGVPAWETAVRNRDNTGANAVVAEWRNVPSAQTPWSTGL